jgi:5'-3' exonuclease
MNIFEQIFSIETDTETHPNQMNPTFIFVDGSYYCFYRYYALQQWWKNAHPEESLEDPYQNATFVEKFKKTFVENLKQLPKKLKIPKTTDPILIVGRDCKRGNIWRNELYPSYKATRVQQEGFMGGPFFKMVYEEELFVKGGVKATLKHPRLEADDCIAISVKYVIQKYPDCTIYIITSDRDYLQLNAPNVHLYNLAFKNIAENKSSTGNPKHDLEIKIIMGDTSDNIPSVFPKCGPKTAQKCIEDPAFFAKKMAENTAYYAQYELNKKLVDFDCIPEEFVNEFMEKPLQNLHVTC